MQTAGWAVHTSCARQAVDLRVRLRAAAAFAIGAFPAAAAAAAAATVALTHSRHTVEVRLRFMVLCTESLR